LNDSNTATLPHPAYISFKRYFSLGQAQALIAGCMGYDLSKTHAADAMRHQLLDRESTLSTILRRNGLYDGALKVLVKLESLPVEKLIHFQRLLATVTALPPSEVFGNGDLPSVHVLRRFGLAPPVGRPIWGLVYLQLANAHYEEIVLQHEPGAMGSTTSSLEQLAQEVMSKYCELADGTASSWDPVFRACYDLAVTANSRFLRVIEEEGGRVRHLPIPVEALRSDVEDGSLRGLVIPGVNAPPPSGAS
jgi:hypothetical protein